MTGEKINILIADDHHLIRAGLRAMLSHIKDFEVVGEAQDGKEVISKTEELSPNVIIMDISMPNINGIEATKLIKSKFPSTKILVLTQHENNEYIYQILAAGGSGYLLKNTPKEDFIDAIRTVAKGENYFSKKISDLIMEQYLINKNKEGSNDRQNSNEKGIIHLTSREKEIIQLIAKEMSNQKIADQLYISLRTVETHRRNIMHKLKLNNVIGLIKYAVQNDIITINNQKGEIKQ